MELAGVRRNKQQQNTNEIQKKAVYVIIMTIILCISATDIAGIENEV
jgi:hypothetical protein